ncbi:MAG TPA: heavy metal-binding domain-containing protein, partial [Bauldia sp.]|nr:heavy metal-binding domain-containing protein [Bauldia sp.]
MSDLAASSAPSEAPTAIDPVCGMTVKLGAGKPTHEHGGVTYHFCSNGCRTKFAADPDGYLKKAQAAPASCCGGSPGHGAHHGHGAPAAPVDPASVPKGALWTCPMHPEIVRDGPGSCPICGM